MNRSILKFLAAAIIVLMGVVAVSNLDGLPRTVRSRIDAEHKELASAETRFHAAQDAVLRDLQTEADLFHGIASSQQWPDQLSKSLGDLQYASRDMDQLDQIRRQDHVAISSSRPKRCWRRNTICAPRRSIRRWPFRRKPPTGWI